MIARSAGAWLIDTLTWCWVRIACAPKNAISEAITISTKLTAAKLAALAHRTGRRWGTAIKLERICPVEYSPEITSTPSTPIASWARW